MVITVIGREIFRQGAKALSRYYKLEGKAFNRLYTGFPQSRTIGRGVRHGLTAGSVAGSFINQAPDTPGNSIQTPFRKQYQTRPSYKTRSRRPVQRFRRCPKQRNYNREY